MKKEPKSRRRDPKAKVGFVKFPTRKIKSTGEGGVFVRLVVLDTKGDEDYMKRYVPCCGGYVSFLMDETFVGDDAPFSFDVPEFKRGQEVEWMEWYHNVYQPKHKEMETRYFPNLYNEEHHDATLGAAAKYLSRDFLAVFLMGATGWSSGEWCCKFTDLTAEGKRFYLSVAKLYPKCELRLLTFLDT